MTLLPARLSAPTTRRRPGTTTPTLSVAEVVEVLFGGPPPFRVTAYDGSATGPADAAMAWHVATPDVLSYLATSPGDLGVARAYLTDSLQFSGFHPGDPYEGFKLLKSQDLHRPPLAQVPTLLRTLGIRGLVPPGQGHRPPLRRPSRRSSPCGRA